jgi:hypothetical protein
MGRVVEVREFHESLHGGNYHFVVEGRRLVYISRYASREEKDDSMVRYYVDLDRIRGRTIIEVSSSRSGPFESVTAFPAEDLPLEWDKRRRQDLPITIVNDYELVHVGLRERQFLSEWDGCYRPMLSYIRREAAGERWLPGVSRLLNLHVRNDLRYPASFLIPYSEGARFASLNSLSRQIHQVWIIMKILKELPAEVPSRPFGRLLDFKQGSSRPIAMVGSYAMWYEFDLNPHTMFDGALWWRKEGLPPAMKAVYDKAKEARRRYRAGRLTLRPDIVFTYAKSPEEFMQRPAIKLILECKNADYAFWEKDVEGQVKPYAEIFQPEYIAIASLKPVPQYVKEGLSGYGVDVVDNVHPGGPGERELIAYIKRALGQGIIWL